MIKTHKMAGGGLRVYLVKVNCRVTVLQTSVTLMQTFMKLTVSTCFQLSSKRSNGGSNGSFLEKPVK